MKHLLRVLLEEVRLAVHQLPVAIFAPKYLCSAQHHRHWFVLADDRHLRMVQPGPETEVTRRSRLDYLEPTMAAFAELPGAFSMCSHHRFSARHDSSGRRHEARRIAAGSDCSQRGDVTFNVCSGGLLACLQELREIHIHGSLQVWS